MGLIHVHPFRCQLCGHRFRLLQWGVRYRQVEDDRREFDRLPINFPVIFAGDAVRGVGSVVDLSMAGCAFHAEARLEEGTILRISLQISTDLPPISVEAAVVRSVSGNRAGVEFVSLRLDERNRLELFLQRLVRGSASET